VACLFKSLEDQKRCVAAKFQCPAAEQLVSGTGRSEAHGASSLMVLGSVTSLNTRRGNAKTLYAVSFQLNSCFSFRDFL
jgi:hypothetical protein